MLGELQPLGSVEKLSCIRCQPRGNKCSSPSPGMQGWKEAVIYPPQLCSSLWNPIRLENTSRSKVAFAFRRPKPRAQWAHLLFPLSQSPHQSCFGGCVALVFYFLWILLSLIHYTLRFLATYGELPYFESEFGFKKWSFWQFPFWHFHCV